MLYLHFNEILISSSMGDKFKVTLLIDCLLKPQRIDLGGH